MSALQIWLQNHSRRLTQDAIDEALMEYIAHVERQRDDLLAALEKISKVENKYDCGDWDEIEEAREIANVAIASVKKKK